jgi:hypothetical protein
MDESVMVSYQGPVGLANKRNSRLSNPQCCYLLIEHQIEQVAINTRGSSVDGGTRTDKFYHNVRIAYRSSLVLVSSHGNVRNRKCWRIEWYERIRWRHKMILCLFGKGIYIVDKFNFIECFAPVGPCSRGCGRLKGFKMKST